jgi:hypothetical protein
VVGERQDRGIFSLVAARWRDGALSFAVIVALSVAYLHLAEKKYTVSATLAPADAEMSILTGISAGSDLGSLSLGRLGLGIGGGNTKFSSLIQQLTSGATAQTLLGDDRVKAAIYHTTWDSRSRSFRPPPGILGGLREAAKAALGMKPWHPPTAADMQRYLSRNLVAREIGLSELYSVTYSNRDPEFARYFLSRDLAISDNYLRQQKLARARAYVAYLDQRLKLLASLDQRQALLKLRSQQENFLMAASVNLPFSGEIDDPPITPSRPTWPNVLIVAVLVIFFGGALAAAAGVYFRPYERLRRRFRATPKSRQATARDGAVAPHRMH